MPRLLSQIEDDVRLWIEGSTEAFRRLFVTADKAWVVKFIDPRFLSSFLTGGQRLSVSATPGFTWGDAVYVTPLRNPYSTMMYGRAGVMGYVAASDIAFAYDASDPRGVELYLEWIQFSITLFQTVATTVHANLANRMLRNSFRRKFRIDAVFFPPDQFNAAYVGRGDHWFALSDWSGLAPQAPGQRPRMSSVVRDCRWVAIVGEQFEESAFKVHYNDLFARHMGRSRRVASRRPLVADLQSAYASAAAGGTNVLLIEP